jgi:hypothetical protein
LTNIEYLIPVQNEGGRKRPEKIKEGHTYVDPYEVGFQVSYERLKEIAISL